MSSKEQKELFKDWKFTSWKISGLKEFFQNDFDRLLADGYTEKEEIRENIIEFEDLFNKNISELTALKDKVVSFMKEKAK